MKHLGVIAFLAAAAFAPLDGQGISVRSYQYVTYDPAGTCSVTQASWYNYTNNKEWGCVGAGPTGTWTQVNASGSALPSGSIIISLSSCPAGYSEATALNGVMLLGTLAANGNVGTTGGSDSITPTGSVSSPSLTMNSYTPAGTNGTVSFTPSGTNGAPAFTGTPGTVPAQTFTGSSATTSAVSGGTPAGTNAWPVGVPTNGSGAFAEGAISWPAGVPTNASGAFSEGALSWPAGVPTAATESAHTHGAGSFADATSGSTIKLFTASGSGVSAATLSGTSGAGSAHTHTLSWPAGVPTIAAGNFTQPTVSWPAGVPAIAAGVFTQPTISWPAGVPAFSGSALGTHTHTLTANGSNGTASFTPAGTVAAPVFTGSAGTISGEAFTGTSATLTGSVSVPSFSGNSFDNRSAFVRVIFCSAN